MRSQVQHAIRGHFRRPPHLELHGQPAGGRDAREPRPLAGENDAKLAQKLAQLQPFIAVFPHKCVGQYAYFGANLTAFSLQENIALVKRYADGMLMHRISGGSLLGADGIVQIGHTRRRFWSHSATSDSVAVVILHKTSTVRVLMTLLPSYRPDPAGVRRAVLLRQLARLGLHPIAISEKQLPNAFGNLAQSGGRTVKTMPSLPRS